MFVICNGVITQVIYMADKEISELTAASALAGDELFHLVQSGNSRKATPAQVEAYARDIIKGYIQGYIFGLTCANGTDATNDIDIGVGEASSPGGLLMSLNSGLTKELDATFSAGDAAGGRFEASISNATWHVFLISNGTAVDVGFSTSLDPTSDPNYPSGYTHYRRIFSIMREGGAIRGFTQLGGHVVWDDSVRDINDSNPGTGSDLRSLTVPTGIQVDADVSVTAQNDSTNAYLMVSSPDSNDSAASATDCVSYINPSSAAYDVVAFTGFVRTDTSGRIRTRVSASAAGTDLRVFTRGYIDSRGRFA